MNVDIDTLFTEKRFKMKKSEITKVLLELEESIINYKKLIEKILDEDVLIKIRLRTFKKCKRNFFLCVLAIVLGVLFGRELAILYLLPFIGVFVLICSAIGMITNFVPREKRKYIHITY